MILNIKKKKSNSDELNGIKDYMKELEENYKCEINDLNEKYNNKKSEIKDNYNYEKDNNNNFLLNN